MNLSLLPLKGPSYRTLEAIKVSFFVVLKVQTVMQDKGYRKDFLGSWPFSPSLVAVSEK